MPAVVQTAEFPCMLKLAKDKLEFERLPDSVLDEISYMDELTSKMRNKTSVN